MVAQQVVEGFGKDGGQGGQGGGLDNQEIDPAPQEPRQPAIAFAQKDVVAARLGQQHGHLGIRQRSQEDEQAAQDPDQGDQAKLRHVLSDGVRLFEDARADHSPDDDGRRHDRTNAADQARCQGGGCRFHPNQCRPCRAGEKEKTVRLCL